MTPTITQLLAVAVGGAIGGMARIWVSGIVARWFGVTFPWGTLVVNVSGAAIIGVLAGILLAPETRNIMNVPAWFGLVIGILGSYTTVSSFSLQTLALVRANEPGRALLNVAGSMALCLASAALGYVAVMRMWGG